MSELFHSRAQLRPKKEVLEEFKVSAGEVADNPRAFALWRRRHPLETLEAIHRASGNLVAFKLFPNHLKPDVLESAFLDRPDMAFAVLTRRPIESYISGLKAQSAGKFGRVNTTDLKPELSVDQFVEWSKHTRRWYRWARKALEARGTPYAKFSYEEHLDGLDPAESLTRVLALLEPLGISGVPMPKKFFHGRRQDKEAHYQDRVANWDDFVKQARADRRAALMLDWAERP